VYEQSARERRIFMAETPSTMLPLGTESPPFRLPNPQGKWVSSDDFKDAPALLVVFMCNHCPYVKHIRSKFAELAKEYQTRGVGFVGINSNDAESYPDDRPEKMAEEIKQVGYTFPYLYDESQEVAKAYRAACTPDFYLFDGDRRLVYRGQFDDSRPGNGRPVTGADLRAALDAVLAGRPIPKDQRPSVGCNIKWKRGNAPDYYSSW
jgi:peroxiredoxin